MSTETKSLYRIEVTEFPSGKEDDCGIQRLLVATDDDPAKMIMRMLSIQTRGPRKGSKKPAPEGASK